MKTIDKAIVCAGYGGQGIMVLGKLLAHAGMECGMNVTWIPSYGAEVRGGTAHSMIRIRMPGKIANPVVTNPDVCIIMNKPSLDKFMPRIAPGGIMIADSANVKDVSGRDDISVMRAPFTEIAVRLGDKRAANMIAAGYMNMMTELFPFKALEESVSFIFSEKPEVCELNKKALAEGYGIRGR
jgi:2-oxoglutarate ferredoxin oxidoreductase subunit gamma